MSAKFTRRRKASRPAEAKATAGEPVAAVRPAARKGGDLEEFLFKAYDFAAHNPMARGYILWVWSDGIRVYAVTNDKYLSNALYHALRALGRNKVRRWSQGGKWIIAYS
ncbi:MAG: hypothetical protein ACO2PN_20350 [Pyrobaculum sp.]|jgi:hypothetical protein